MSKHIILSHIYIVIMGTLWEQVIYQQFHDQMDWVKMFVSTTLKGHRNILLHVLSIKNIDVLEDLMHVQMFVHGRGKIITRAVWLLLHPFSHSAVKIYSSYISCKMTLIEIGEV